MSIANTIPTPPGINVSNDLAFLYSRIFGYVGPPFPGLPGAGVGNFGDRFNVVGAAASVLSTFKKASPLGRPEIMSVAFTHPQVNGGSAWKFPYQPIVSLIQGNRIIRRFPASSGGVRGSIKELWSQDDTLVTLEGVLMYQPANVREDKYADQMAPQLESDMQMLHDFMNTKVVEVLNPKLNQLGVSALCIEGIRWLPYSHAQVHPFRLTGYSEDVKYELFE